MYYSYIHASLEYTFKVFALINVSYWHYENGTIMSSKKTDTYNNKKIIIINMTDVTKSILYSHAT